MTPEQEQRIRQLSVLIASEPDTEKTVTLAAELGKLLALKLDEMKSARTLVVEMKEVSNLGTKNANVPTMATTKG